MDSYSLKIWGSRGSVAQTSDTKRKFGLNTTCISIETPDNIILIDGGTGIASFDTYLYENKLTHKKISILLTHYHYDHILGLPFTKFLYDKNVKYEIYGPKFTMENASQILKKIVCRPFFPLDLKDVENAKILNLDNSIENKFNGIKIKTITLNHKDNAIGYKFIFPNKEICIITDYEYNTDNNKDELMSFIRNSDILIMDTYFTNEDYIENWGHSTIENCVELTNKLNIRQGMPFHHNINYTDDFLINMEKEIQKKSPNIIFTRDGYTLNF